MTNKVQTGCGKCGGNGRYYFQGGSDVCYPCNGTGRVWTTEAKLAAGRAYVAKMEARMLEERGRMDREEEARLDSEAMIDARGIRGAREFFAAHREDVAALAGLIGAMRNARLFDASNAVVAHRNALIARGGK